MPDMAKIGPVSKRLLGLALVFTWVAGPFFASEALAQESLQAGEGYITRFSGTTRNSSSETVIDVDGTVGSVVDLRTPSQPPKGQHWLNEPQHDPVSAGEIGQVFGVTLDDATPPNIYLTATSVFGLHREPDNSDWMAGMWGPGGGPGTVWKLDPATDNKPVKFVDIGVGGRANTGAALGNIAYDKWNHQLYVSDLETGLIHRLRSRDGADLGQFDHGVSGRAAFLDVATSQQKSLPPVAFDPSSSARINDCPDGAFARTPSCWNFADFRRRVWGVGVRKDPQSGQVRLYYAIWSSQALGSPDFASADDEEKRNSVWSVALTNDGAFDLKSVRQEYLLPDFFTNPADIARAGRSNPVADIAFCKCKEDNIMLVAERGGVRNLGLDAEDPFATPHESRVLRYELESGNWQLKGRYDLGFYDRKDKGQPYIRANSSGGVDFGYGYQQDWTVDLAKPDAFVWMNGALCSPHAPCFVPDVNKRIDGSHVDGTQGTPEFAFDEVLPPTAMKPYPSSGDPYPPIGPTQSWMIDTDNNIDASGAPAMDSLIPNHATMIGDIEIYQLCEAEGPPVVEEPPLVEDQPPLVDEPPVIVDPPVVAPPIDEGPDLEKMKTGPAQCTEGDICTFTITISNNGPGEWSGPLWERDTLPPGATLFDYRPQPDWICNQVGSEVICNFGWVTLAPGDSVTLEMDVFIPFGTAGQIVENCVEDIWLPSWDPTDPAVIQAIEQALAGFGYIVGPIDGFLDIVTMNAISILQVDNGLPVTGIPDQAVIDLLFSGSAGLPGDYNPANDGDCHQVEIVPAPPPPAPATPAAPAAPPAPDMQVRKLQTTGQCRPGGLCTFRLIFINRGPGEWTGIPEMIDTLPPGATLVNPPVGCRQLSNIVACRYPQTVILPPNSPASVTITVRMPANIQPGAQNCVDLSPLLMPGDPNPGNNRQCIPIRVAPPPVPDIQIHKSQTPDQCTPGESCTFDLWFINRGPGKWTGAPQLSDDLPPNTKFKSASATWKCQQSGRNVTCTHDKVTLPPGRAIKVSVTVDLPRDLAPDAKNCVRGEGDGDASHDLVPANNERCITIVTAPPPQPTEPAHAEEPTPAEPTEPQAPPPAEPSETRVEKTQLGPCKPGRSCLFELKFLNKGPGTWTGNAKLADLLPDAQTKLGTWSPPTWQCDQTRTAISCEHSGATVAPGEYLSVTMTLQLPEHLQPGAQNCAVVERPEIGTIDPNIIGDRHCVTIDMVTPGFAPHPPAVVHPTTPCPEGTVRQEGQCVTITQTCPEGYVLKGDRCYSTTLTCPKGYVLKGKTCYSTKLSCPKGYVLKGKRCYSTKRSCPKGYVLRGNRCYPPATQRACPWGTVRMGNVCVRIPSSPGIRIPSPGHGHGHRD